MKRLKLIISATILTTLLTNTVYADPACDKVIKACDSLVAAQKEQLSAQNKVIQHDIDELVKAYKTINERDDQLSSVFRNPFVMVGLGILVGGLTVALVKR